MARRSRTRTKKLKSNSARASQRNANRRLHQNPYKSDSYQTYSYQPDLFDDLPLVTVEDRRSFHPHGKNAWPQLISGRDAVIAANAHNTKPMSHPTYSPIHVAFEQPQEVITCVRRNSRKEVLHAKGIAGKKGLRKPRRNPFSSVKC